MLQHPCRQYNGRVFDQGTGFHDYGARMYWPQIGRFISADPVHGDPASPASLNRYSYVLNNPYKYTDPTGQTPEGAFQGAMVGGAVGGAVGFLLGGGGGVVVAVFTGGAGSVAIPAAALQAGALGSAAGIAVGHWIGDLVSGPDVMQAAKIKPGTAGGDRAGKPFTPKGAAEIDAENAARHGGQNVCENCGVEVVPGQRSQRGVTPPGNERQRDHVIPRSKGGDGDPSNGQVYCRDCNIREGAKDK